jgi:hypothetical protein
LQKKTILDLQPIAEVEQLIEAYDEDRLAPIYPILNSYKECLFWIPTAVQKEKIFRYRYEVESIDHNLFDDMDEISQPLIGTKTLQVTLKEELRTGMTEVTKYPEVILKQGYYIDVVECPKSLITDDKLVTIGKFDRLIKSNVMIQERMKYLESKGYVNIVHFDPGTIISKVLENGPRIKIPGKN